MLAVMALLFLGSSRPAHGASFAVTSTSDAVDSNTLDGVCNDGLGNCTLRAAIMQANALGGADTITVPAGTYTLSVPGTGEDQAVSGDLDIGGDLTINGGGAGTTIVDGADLDRVVHVVAGTTQISGLTIQNGTADSAGGILNHSALILNHSTVRGNTAIFGIFGVLGVGGGIESGGVGAVLILNNSTVSGNTASYNAGGIHNVGTVTLNSSTVSGNTSGNDGGGFSNCCGGTATLNNSTVSGNIATHGGGGISGGATLDNSTVSANTAATGGGVYIAGGSATVKNTVVANGSPNDCDGGTITSAGHNLIENAGSCTIGGNSTGNITGVDPVLGALANNGGATRTHALLPGSPAIDAGSPDCPPPTADQRGAARPQGGACDIGSVEFESRNRYCIKGLSTGAGWAWAVGSFNGSVANGTVSPGGTESQIAGAWVLSMNGAFAGAMTASQLPGNQAHCFRITQGKQTLIVNGCTVTKIGCSFNPTVTEEEPVGGVVDMLVEAGPDDSSGSTALYPSVWIAAASFVLGAGLWYGRKRWLR